MRENKTNTIKNVVDNRDLREKLAWHLPVEVEPIKSKEKLTEKMRELNFSKKFIANLPKYLDEFIILYKSGLKFNYNILIVDDREIENINAGKLICSYLSANGITSNLLLTEYRFDSIIAEKQNFCSVKKFDYDYPFLLHDNMQIFENIISILLISKKDYSSPFGDIFVENYPFVIYNEYEKNEEHDLFLKYINNFGFELENKNTLQKLMDGFSDFKRTKNI